MTVTETKPGCFIFLNPFEPAIYRYLMTHHRDAVEAIKTRMINIMESDEDRIPDMTLPQWMDWELKSFFGEQAPIEVSPIDGAYFNDSDIFEELLSEAISKCDFQRIAEAFLMGLELPPYLNENPPQKTSVESEASSAK